MLNILLLTRLMKRPGFKLFSFLKIHYRKKAQMNTVQVALETVLKCSHLESFTDTVYGNATSLFGEKDVYCSFRWYTKL